MYKASIEIASINKVLKVKFGIIVQSESELQQSSYFANHLVSKFKYAGNDFLRINPRPYITLDISKGSDRGEGWSSNQTVNLNKQKLYEFNKKFKRFVNQYKEIKELYYYENEKLKLDNEIARNIMFDIIANNKRIRIQPCVVPGENTSETEDIIEYEGCILCINTYDNYVYMTYGEMEYLLYELEHLDLIQLSLSMIQIVNMYKNEEEKELQLKPPITQKEEEEIKSKPFVKIEEPNTIPKI